MFNKRTLEQLTRQHFKFDDKVNKNKCDITDCKSILTGDNFFTLKRHIECVHPSTWTKITEEAYSEGDDDDNYPLQREKMLQSFVETVTVNGRPINALFDSGLLKSTD